MFSDNDVEKSFVEELKNNSWELKDKKLVKLFQFPSFIRAIDFVNEIAIIVRARQWKVFLSFGDIQVSQSDTIVI
jgi:pterin-4a-carbinolamine dehydratase